MRIAFVSVGSAGLAGSGNVSPGNPASLFDNDILILAGHSRDNVSWSVDNGYTLIVSGNAGLNSRIEVWWKRTTGVEGTTTITHTAGNTITARIYADEYTQMAKRMRAEAELCDAEEAAELVADARASGAWRDLGYEGPLSHAQVVEALEQIDDYTPQAAAVAQTDRQLRADLAREKERADNLDRQLVNGMAAYVDKLCERDALAERVKPKG